MSGALYFRATRIPILTPFDPLEMGELDASYAGFPSVGPEMVKSVLRTSRDP